MSSKNSSKADQPQRTTVVGIGAQGSAEDWSSEFVLEGSPVVRGTSFRNKPSVSSGAKEKQIFQSDDAAATDSDDDTLPATLNYTSRRAGLPEIESFSEDEEVAEEEDEDWDEELGITDEVLESQESMMNGFRHVMSDTLGLAQGGVLDDLTKPLQAEDTVRTTIPTRCKVVSMLLQGSDDVNMLVYPKSIPLYSLKIDGDKKQLMAMQLDDWLKNIVHKHKDRVDFAMRSKDIGWLKQFQSRTKNFSRQLFNAWAEVVDILWRNNSVEIYDLLKEFWKMFRQFSKMDKFVVRDISQMSEADYNMSFIQVCRVLRVTVKVDVLESISGRYTDGAGKRNDHHFKMIITDSSSLSKTKKHNLTGHDPLFPEMLKCATVLFPDKLELLAVLELQAASHHITMMLDNRIESNYSPTPYELFKSHVFLYRSLSSSVKDKTRSMEALKVDKKPSRRDKDRYDDEIKMCDTAIVATLCDVCLLVNGYDSLNIRYSKNLAAAINMIFVEKNGVGIYSSDSDEEYNEKTTSRSNSNNTRSRTSSSRSSTKSEKERLRLRNSARHMMDEEEADISSFSPRLGNNNHNSASSSIIASLTQNSLSNNSRSASNMLSQLNPSRAMSKMSTSSLSMELFENESVSLFDTFVKMRTHRFLVSTLLSKKYKRVSRKSSLKPVVAYTLGLLQSLEDETVEAQERTESLWLECLVLLDKQSDARESEVSPPIVSLFAVGVLESFAEHLIKTSKYKFGVSSFEAVTECLLLLNSKDVKRLYRRLMIVSTEARDVKRSIYYHCIMLRLAIEEGKVNEFVYIADLVGRLFIEVGEIQLSERCLRVVALLHQGYTIRSVRFEKINLDKLLLNILPDGIELPYVDLNVNNKDVVSRVPGALLWARRANDSVQCDSQQLNAIMKLVETYFVSDYHQMALALCSCVLSKKVFPQGRIYVLMTMAKCFLKLRELDKCEATLDRIAFEADEIVNPLLSSEEDPNSSSRTYGRSLSHCDIDKDAVNNSKRDLNKASRLNSDKRRVKLSRITSNGNIYESHPNSSHHMSAALLAVVAKVRSYDYIILRARCRLAADDPEWAILWLQIAMAICPSGKFDKHGKIRYLTGRAYMMLCLHCHMGGGAVPPELVDQESQYASKAEEEFRAALALYKHTGEIVKETKTLSRIVELHLSRVFTEIAVEQSAPLPEALHGRAENTLRSLESLSRLAMQLAGDVCAPLELIRTLVNTAELSWLTQNVQLSFSAWYEAKTLLTITYLQSLVVDPAPPPVPNNPRRPPSANSKIKKTFSFGSLGSINNASSNAAFSSTDFIADPLNPVSDAPLPVVKFPPGMLLRIYSLLTRLVRLAFVIEPCPLSHYGGKLLASWTRLNNVVSTMGMDLGSDLDDCYLKKKLSTFRNVCSYYSSQSTDTNGTDFFSQETMNALGYLCTEVEDKRVLLETLSSNNQNREQNQHSDETNHKKKSGNEGDSLLDTNVLLSSLNMMLPFELTLRSFIVDGLDGIELDGARAADNVLNYLRRSVFFGLINPTSEAARNITRRGLSPGVTMSSAGHFVDGVMDHHAAEVVVRKNPELFSSDHHDLSALLKRNNDVYTPSDGYLNPMVEPQDCLNEILDEGDCNDSMAKLLGSHPKKSRIQILFLRLKAFSEQYSMGHLSLTEYYRKNMDTLRSIVNAQNVIEEYYGSLAAKNDRLERNRMSRSFANVMSPTHQSAVTNKRSLVRSQTRDVMDTLEGQDDSLGLELKKCYAPSFRFVIQLEPNSLLLYVPRLNMVSTAVFRSPTELTSLENTPVTTSRRLVPYIPGSSKGNSSSRYGKAVAVRKSCGGPTSVKTESTAKLSKQASTAPEDYSMDKIYGSSRFDLPALSKYVAIDKTFSDNPMANSAANVVSTLTSTLTSNSLSDAQDAASSHAMVSRSCSLLLKSLADNQLFITPLISAFYVWSDASIISAYQSMPLPTEDIHQTNVDVSSSSESQSQSKKIKDELDRYHELEGERHSVDELLGCLGLQKALFLLSALMLEESVLLIIAPGSEQLLIHVSTALLRLLRPMNWQHVYVPYMQSTLYPQFRKLVECEECFFVGSYRQILDVEVNAHRKICKDGTGNIDPYCLPRLSQVTIADLNSGHIKPSCKLAFSYLCTVFDPESFDISIGEAAYTPPLFFPEAGNNPYFDVEQLRSWALDKEAQLRRQEHDIDDRVQVAAVKKQQSIEHVKLHSSRNLFDLYSSKRGFHSSSSIASSVSSSDDSGVLSQSACPVRMSPPIPARYRAHVYERLFAVLNPLDLPVTACEVLSRPFDENKTLFSDNTRLVCSAVFMDAMFQVMVSMFKGVKCFLRPASFLSRTASATVSSKEAVESGADHACQSGAGDARRSYGQKLFALSDPPGGYSCLACQPLERDPHRKLIKLAPNSKLSKLLDSGMLAVSSRNDDLALPVVDEKYWLSFLKDDLQSFARHILHTKSFKFLTRDILLCQLSHRRGHSHRRFLVSRYFYSFMQKAHEKLLHKMTMYRAVSSQRIAGYMITYFGRIDAQLDTQFDDECGMSQDEFFETDVFDGDGASLAIPFLHTFPFTPSLVKASLKTMTNAKREPSLRIKRRWCVLDANRFTYFKSRSKLLGNRTDPKNYISVDASTVRLVMSPFNHHAERLHFADKDGKAMGVTENRQNCTSSSDAFALVSGSFVIILRAENLAEHNRWLLAFRSRLMKADTIYDNLEQHDNYKSPDGSLLESDPLPSLTVGNQSRSKTESPILDTPGFSSSSIPSQSSSSTSEPYQAPIPNGANRTNQYFKPKVVGGQSSRNRNKEKFQTMKDGKYSKAKENARDPAARVGRKYGPGGVSKRRSSDGGQHGRHGSRNVHINDYEAPSG